MELICNVCKSKFEKDDVEYRRRLKKGQKNFYCSLHCCGIKNAKNISKAAQLYGSKKGTEQLIKLTKKGNFRDEYSPFRYYLARIRDKVKRHGKTDIDLIYLKQLWELQDGMCPYAKKKMILPATSQCRHNNLFYASLDRIDSSRGYLKGNVEFVTMGINLMKNKFSRNEVIDLLR